MTGLISAGLHTMMPHVQRGASVFVAYLTLYRRQALYMADNSSFEQPETESGDGR